MSGTLALNLSAQPLLESAAYALDSWQRGVLFLDTLRQRGNQLARELQKPAPTVLSFAGELVLDGRTLPRPVNYGLIRITPPAGTVIDERKRPFVVVDPRAGHGPGIGGFKPDSEIGVALRAGHPCYFIGFLPLPVPGQTIEDVMRAEQAFLEAVARAHPEADGRPVAIGNCQAGWQLAMAAATRPDLFGPLILAGAPLSYWAGEHGRNPMRYAGGLLGGTWLTALAGDLGHGLFDGAWLVQNFETLNPANTLWTKQYALYDRIDTEPARYLGFERWWTHHVLTNAGEMQDIVDKLFVGNRLATAELATREGERIDLRNITTPIVVFCSEGDNITPPPQALGWITDLYDSVDDIRAAGQTIVYMIHPNIGHLGIFVSGSIARREHEEFASNIDFIDVLPPGLYEAEILDGSGPGGHLLRFAAREIEELRAITRPDPEDDRKFATVRRVAEINLGLYRQFLQPLLRATVTAPMAEALRQLHPLRFQYSFFSDSNPAIAAVAPLAQAVAAHRRPVPDTNPWRQAEHAASAWIEAGLMLAGALRDHVQENLFHAVYGQKLLQSLVGLGARDEAVRRRPGLEPGQQAFRAARIRELQGRIAEGGPRAAFLRLVAYIGLAERRADERSFAVLRALWHSHGGGDLAAFKALLREQFLMLRLDRDAALAALPAMLGDLPPEGIPAFAEALRQVATAAPLHPAAAERLAEVEARLALLGAAPLQPAS
ncbi:hypothetical protein BKE38_21285 [Pseudoroseomonas deserti]|uniref:3-hydroxyalkanoate synthetase n=1 Tax=Teichococcus deserti TaxID=1817963 RepID=A0A1V2GX79_9PROT|nr:DUF3141 domain-containing protein [Pseudoroseomonas deserti]ONG48992.1 hypothetical protein BKE38_21285 [Pseudoroseomonas deserti]